jgi:uncharacterized protein (TIRG00374 family)
MNPEAPIQPERKPVNKWYLALTIVISAILLVLAIRGVSWAEMVATIQTAKPQYLVILFLCSSISIFLRGVRWGVLVSAQKKVDALTMFWAASVGYLGNAFLPARAGEVIRSVMLGTKTGISKSYVFATAMTERILDVIILVLIGVVSLPSIGTLPDWLSSAMRVMGILGLAALVFLFLAPRFSHLLERFIRWLPIPERIRLPLIRMMHEFLLGAGAFMNPGRAAGFAIYSALLWFVDATGTIMLSWGLNMSFTYPQAFVLLLAMGLSSAIPSTPGYVGVYQFVAVTLLPIYGISRSEALTFIIAMQAVNTLAILTWGFIGLWRLNLRQNPSVEST